MRLRNLTIKRTLDLLLATLALMVLSPVLLGVSILVWLGLGRPILFRQKRLGFKSVPFMAFKFRSMTDQRNGQGRLLPDGQRITRLGAFLRRSSLDELPQLWNVFRGDMSFVGPRPLLAQYLDRYTREQARRHSVRPGITGWAQVNGRNATEWEQRFAYDLWYVDHCSFALDLRILAMTLLRVLQSRGISPAETSTMPEFMGRHNSLD